MEDGGEDMELKYELWKESIVQEKVICECRKRLSGYRRAVFCFIVELNISFVKLQYFMKFLYTKEVFVYVMSTGLQHLLIRINIRYF